MSRAVYFVDWNNGGKRAQMKIEIEFSIVEEITEKVWAKIREAGIADKVLSVWGYAV